MLPEQDAFIEKLYHEFLYPALDLCEGGIG